jgi:hypothetical protein
MAKFVSVFRQKYRKLYSLAYKMFPSKFLRALYQSTLTTHLHIYTKLIVNVLFFTHQRAPYVLKLRVSFLLSCLQCKVRDTHTHARTHTHTELGCYWCKNYGEKKIREQGNAVHLHNADRALLSFPLNSTRFLCNNLLLFPLKYATRKHLRSARSIYFILEFFIC